MARSGSRLFHWLSWLVKGRGVATPAPAAQAPPPTAAEPDDEARLATYLRRIGILDERPEKADAAELLALQRLVRAGQTAVATRLGGALAAALPTDDTLQLLVADLLLRQQLGEAALPLLRRVLASANPTAEGQTQRLRARWLLAEIAAAQGQTAEACAQLGQLLAEDFHYPGARERLRALLGASATPPMMKSAEPWSATLHAATATAPTLLGGGLHNPRYRLRRELGSGRSGTVYLADDEELGCEVALKLFHPQKQRPHGLVPPAASSQPALREARLLSALRHPGVLLLYELDEAGRYLTMELCEGGSLRARLQGGPLPPAAALRRAFELGDTLRAVHALHVIHGDVKPENLLFRSPGRSLLFSQFDPPYGDLVLGDFGVAVGTDGEVAAAEMADAAGTRAYLPPERLRGGASSAAADLYAFGVVIGEMFGPALAAAPAALRALVDGLKSPDPAARPTAVAAQATLHKLLPATEAH